MMKHTKGFLLTLGALMLAPAAAQAAPDTASAAALIGYGFHDVGGFGLGARGGYTLSNNVYIGGTFVYHLGTSEETPAGDVTVNMFYLGAEGGYDFELDPVIIRPYIGLGPAFVKGSVPEVCLPGFGCVGGGSETNTYFGFWLGASVLYPINEQWFIGGDFKLPIVDGEVIPTLAFTGGLNF